MAVMKEDIGSGLMTLRALAAALDVGEDAISSDGLPVVTHGVPLDEFEAKLLGDAKDRRTARSVGRAKIAYGSAESVLEGLVAGAKLLTNDFGGLKT
jgi:hypothetical protein